MFWRLGLLQGISPIHHLAQLRSKLTGAPSLQARSAAEGIYVVSRERLAAFIAEAQKRYNDNPYHR